MIFTDVARSTELMYELGAARQRGGSATPHGEPARRPARARRAGGQEPGRRDHGRRAVGGRRDRGRGRHAAAHRRPSSSRRHRPSDHHRRVRGRRVRGERGLVRPTGGRGRTPLPAGLRRGDPDPTHAARPGRRSPRGAVRARRPVPAEGRPGAGRGPPCELGSLCRCRRADAGHADRPGALPHGRSRRRADHRAGVMGGHDSRRATPRADQWRAGRRQEPPDRRRRRQRPRLRWPCPARPLRPRGRRALPTFRDRTAPAPDGGPQRRRAAALRSGGGSAGPHPPRAHRARPHHGRAGIGGGRRLRSAGPVRRGRRRVPPPRRGVPAPAHHRGRGLGRAPDDPAVPSHHRLDQGRTAHDRHDVPQHGGRAGLRARRLRRGVDPPPPLRSDRAGRSRRAGDAEPARRGSR